MSQRVGTADTSTFLKTTLSYLKPDTKYETEKPYTCAIDLSEVAGAAPTNIAHLDVSDISVRDIRQSVDRPSLEKNGFELVKCAGDFPVEDFDNVAWIEKTYYPFICDFVVHKLGAKEALVFQHQLRYRHPGFGNPLLQGAKKYDPPIPQVHADQTPAAAEIRFENHWPNYSDGFKSDRRQLINLWRPLVDEVTEWPLALCDPRSVDSSDLLAGDLITERYVGENYLAYYNSKHEWSYVSNQTSREMWMFKTYDSTSGSASPVLHTAFDIGLGKTARKSIELRVLVIY